MLTQLLLVKQHRERRLFLDRLKIERQLRELTEKKETQQRQIQASQEIWRHENQKKRVVVKTELSRLREILQAHVVFDDAQKKTLDEIVSSISEYEHAYNKNEHELKLCKLKQEKLGHLLSEKN